MKISTIVLILLFQSTALIANCADGQLDRIEKKLDQIIEKRTIDQDRMMVGYVNNIRTNELPKGKK